MRRQWSVLPQGAVLVGVVLTGVPAVASAGQGEQGEDTEVTLTSDVSVTDEPGPVAPTCGPCCHGMDCPVPGPDAPEPIEAPARSRGCSVDEPAEDPLGLALFGVGALAVGLRRRRS